VYYFWCSFRAAENSKKPVFVVPTGNFGNIFAGYYAKQMGLPVERFILATNENNILSRFINEGDYTSKEVVATYSPSMDIQIASNFERYLYFFYNKDASKVEQLMKTLKTEKGITFPPSDIAKVQEEFGTYSASNDETEEVIASFYKNTGYIIDPHTACGVAAGLQLKTDSPVICLSTAHPAKFPDVVVKSAGIEPEKPAGILKLEGLPRKVEDISNDTEAVKEFIKRNV
jgi:threonine synthase